MTLESAQQVGFSYPEVKTVRLLMQGKNHGDLFVAEGIWAVEKLLKAHIAIECLLFCPEKLHVSDELQAAALAAQQVYSISAKVCDSLTDRDAAEGCFFLCRFPHTQLTDVHLPETALIAILDGLDKPGNVGNIIRTMEGAGGCVVILTHRRVALTHQRLIRASLGAAWTMPVLDVPFEELLPWLAEQGFRVLLTDLSAACPYYEADYSGRVAIVAGNEIYGISPEWRTQTDVSVQPVIIPMAGACESLNVGIATTIVAFEAGLRQRGLLQR